MFDGSYSQSGEYPAWEYKAESHIRNVFADTYREITGKEPEIKAIHAGLECGIFCDKIEGIDCISLGPNMSGVHTTEERLSISSTERTWKLLVEVLKRLKYYVTDRHFCQTVGRNVEKYLNM